MDGFTVFVVQITPYEGGSIVSVHLTEQGAKEKIRELDEERNKRDVTYPDWYYMEYVVE